MIMYSFCETDWAATGAMIGGVATAVYAIFTWLLWKNSKEILLETQRQHREDYRPWIRVQNFKLRRRAFGNQLIWCVETDIVNWGKSTARITAWHVSWID